MFRCGGGPPWTAAYDCRLPCLPFLLGMHMMHACVRYWGACGLHGCLCASAIITRFRNFAYVWLPACCNDHCASKCSNVYTLYTEWSMYESMCAQINGSISGFSLISSSVVWCHRFRPSMRMCAHPFWIIRSLATGGIFCRPAHRIRILKLIV